MGLINTVDFREGGIVKHTPLVIIGSSPVALWAPWLGIAAESRFEKVLIINMYALLKSRTDSVVRKEIGL
jgi:hypothetical protein